MKILMVLTSHDQLGDTGRKTGFWPEEFADPLLRLQRAKSRLSVRRSSMTLRVPLGYQSWRSIGN
jgi:hypothetical protein